MLIRDAHVVVGLRKVLRALPHVLQALLEKPGFEAQLAYPLSASE
jgi:hypothetical protein